MLIICQVKQIQSLKFIVDINAGKIPHELSQLSNLLNLDLNNNNLTGNGLFHLLDHG
jgi:hypothetical protein